MRRSIWWPDILREILDISPDKLMVISIAIGYPDNSARVNGYPRHREPLKEITRWYGF
jgi:hypothetical protein